MNVAIDLLTRLEAAQPEDWESVYMSAPDISPSDLVRAQHSESKFRGWLFARFEAGAPGLLLPEPCDALTNLQEGRGTAADAYAYVFHGQNKPAGLPELSDEECLSVIHLATMAAGAEGKAHLAAMLTRMSFEAAIVLGYPARAQQGLEVLASSERGSGFFYETAALLPLLADPILLRSYWLRIAYYWNWTSNGIAKSPTLPEPEPQDNELPLQDVLKRLLECKAEGPHHVLMGFVYQFMLESSEISYTRMLGTITCIRFTHETDTKPEIDDALVKAYPTNVQVIREAVRLFAEGLALQDFEFPEAESFYEEALNLLPRTDPFRLNITAALAYSLADEGRAPEAVELCLQEIGAFRPMTEGPANWQNEGRNALGKLHCALSAIYDENLGLLGDARKHIETAISRLDSLESEVGKHFIELRDNLKQRQKKEPNKMQPQSPKQVKPQNYVALGELDATDIETQKALLLAPSGKEFIKRTLCLRALTATEATVPKDFAARGFKFAASVSVRPISSDEKSPETIRKALANPPPEDSDAHIGYLCARAMVLAHLARGGHRSVDEVREATEAVRANIHREPNPVVRATFLYVTGDIWAPDNTANDPVTDFALAAELLRQSIDVAGGEEHALVEVVSALGRALRYKPGGAVESLREARRLYELALKRLDLTKAPTTAANLHQLLADVESQLGLGGRAERLGKAERLRESSLEGENVSPRVRAQNLSNLAWDQTQIAYSTTTRERQMRFERALKTFDRVDLSLLEPHEQKNHRHNRTVCEAGSVNDRQKSITIWRDRLATLDRTRDSFWYAIAQHNLSNELLFGNGVTPDEFKEGLRHGRQAAEVRTIETNPRHHWETATNLGRALSTALACDRSLFAPLSIQDARNEAELWLDSAVQAARRLGNGQELHQNGLDLCKLAILQATLRTVDELGSRAWSIVREASPYLVQSQSNPEKEAETARWFAVEFARRIAQEKARLKVPPFQSVFTRNDAQDVERWVVRSQQPARRKLQARLSRPSQVSLTTWESFQEAIRSKEQRTIIDALEKVREHAPDFLAEDRANETTWQWLKDTPGAIAVSLTGCVGQTLITLMTLDSDGERQIEILTIELPPPPHAVETLPKRLGHKLPTPNDAAFHNEMAQWLRSSVIDPVLGYLVDTPSAVLWNPDPYLRLLSPSALWGTVPVATTTSFVLPDLSAAPAREHSTLVVLADPGGSGPQALGDYGTGAVHVAQQAAAGFGDVHLLASRGAKFGANVLNKLPAVIESPASPETILKEASKHQVLVFIAHGEASSTEDAALLCLDEKGNTVRLNVAALQKSPDAFTGATVLLLSCDSGRMNHSLSEPNGVAGTMLSAGARCVVAPLWPIQLDIAELIAKDVLVGLQHGHEPWQVLAQGGGQTNSGSPTLGPPKTKADTEAHRELQRLGFVTWIG